jgi:hypothetical protein
MHTNATPSKVFNAIRLGLAIILGLSALAAVSVYAFAPEVLGEIHARAGLGQPAPERAQVEDATPPEQAENDVANTGGDLRSASHARR